MNDEHDAPLIWQHGYEAGSRGAGEGRAGMTPKQYEDSQRNKGLVSDMTYGTGFGAHPYDFYPDGEESSDAEIAAHEAACQAVAEGRDYLGPSRDVHGDVIVRHERWGLGGVRYWLPKG